MRRLASSIADFFRGSLTLWLALGLLIVAMVLPPLRLLRPSYEWLVVFDITQSMDVEDYVVDGSPVSRLEHAKASVARALADLPCGSRVGWAAFTEYRTLPLLAPVEVCSNYDDLLGSLANIEGRMRWANASEVIKGVYWAIRASREMGTVPAVLFVTDGQEAPPLDPAYRPPVFQDVTPGEVRGWIIGAGSYTPSPIPRSNEEGERIGYWRPQDVIQLGLDPAIRGARPGGEHLSSLREPHLRALAEQVGFEYRRLEDRESISSAMRDPRFARRTRVPVDFSWLPAVAALALLVVRYRPDLKSRQRGYAAARSG